MNILLADDEKEVIEMIKQHLESKGYNIDIAFDGSTALDLIKAKDYDLVIVDHNMPELTGLELIKYVKQNEPKTKTAMITGYSPMKDFLLKIWELTNILLNHILQKILRMLLKNIRVKPKIKWRDLCLKKYW